MEIYLSIQGQRQGPLSLEQINDGVRRGAFSADAALAWYEGAASWMPLRQVPGVVAPDGPPPLPPLPPEQGDATGGIIPYKNPHALTAYYLSIFGLFPLLGFFLAVPAVILGISGLRKRKANPVIKGSVHAWIGIVLGLLSIGYNGLIIVVMIVGLCMKTVKG